MKSDERYAEVCIHYLPLVHPTLFEISKTRRKKENTEEMNGDENRKKRGGEEEERWGSILASAFPICRQSTHFY